MALHMFVFPLVVCLLLSLALLWRHDWLHLRPSASRGRAPRSRLHRLLKPRCPDDCPACRIASAASSGVEPVPALVRPWREVKSRRGARHPGKYRGICLSQPAVPLLRHHRCSDPRSRRRWQTWPSRADPNVSRSCLPYHVHCQAQHSPVQVENPLSCRVAVVLAALAEGWTLPRLNASSALVSPPSRRGSLVPAGMRIPCTSASSAICTSRTCN
jgi:hypothetical protein